MRTRGRSRFALVAMGVALTLAGCQDGGGGGTTTPSTTAPVTTSSSVSVTPTSPSTTTTPTPSPSVIVPQAAREHTDAGAIAFAKFFTREVDRAYVTGDNRFIKSHSTKDCNGCTPQYEGVERVVKKGLRQEALSMSIQKAEIKGQIREDLGIWVTVKVRQVQFVDLKSGAATETKTEPGIVIWQVGLRRTSQGWAVSEFAGIQDGK